MTKSEFVDQVASESGLSKGDATKAVEASLQVIEDTLKRGGEINFTGFGKFSVADRGQQGPEVQRRLGSEEEHQGNRLTHFADRVAALVEERRSQIVLGLDPDPSRLWQVAVGAESVSEAVTAHCRAGLGIRPKANDIDAVRDDKRLTRRVAELQMPRQTRLRIGRHDLRASG